MADVLVRDVPDDVLAALDARAGRLGLSRSEYLRRRLTEEASISASNVSEADLARLAQICADLADPEVMARAWH